jgi:hypothetical protein
MKCYVESIFGCSADKVWEALQTSALLLEIMRPLIRVAPADGTNLPERWGQATQVRCRLYLFGVLPLGTRRLIFERIDPAAREIQTREQDPVVRRWDHRIRAQARDDGRTDYSDEIEIDAGLLTLPVWLFAHWFYRHRQRRWRAIARGLGGIGEPDRLGQIT